MRDLNKEFKTASKKTYKLKIKLFKMLPDDNEKIKNIKKVQAEFQLLTSLADLLEVIETTGVE